MIKSAKFLIAAAIGSASLAAASAHATTYDLFPSPLSSVTTSTVSTDNTGPGWHTDDFTFQLLAPADGYFTAAITESAPYFDITSMDLTLYSGAVGSGTALATTNAFNPNTVKTPTLSAWLDPSTTPADYYLQASYDVADGSHGSYTVTATVSPTPEPAAWALMIVGVGMAGVGLRQVGKRRGAALAAA